MREQAKRLFLLRLDTMVDSGMKSITVQTWQRDFLQGLTHEAGGTITYRGVPLRILDDHPGPATISRTQ